MPDTLEYPTPASSLPDANFRWLDASNAPIDFTTGWSFSMKIAQPPNSAQVTKTNGFIGGDGAGGVANLTVTWEENELADLTAGRWYFQLTATELISGKQRILTGSIRFDFQPM